MEDDLHDFHDLHELSETSDLPFLASFSMDSIGKQGLHKVLVHDMTYKKFNVKISHFYNDIRMVVQKTSQGVLGFLNTTGATNNQKLT
jgi:hypothetical protein